MYTRSKLILLIFFLSIGTMGTAQVVTTNPPFPLTDQPVTISFNATMGSGGLAGYSGDVYAHTGVITSESSGPSDWKYVKTAWGENTPDTKLTRTGLNSYFLTVGPSIRDNYGVPMDEEILQIALVFRSGVEVGGSYLEGKTSSNGDIFVDVFEEDPGLILVVLKPEEKDQLVLANSSIPVRFDVSSPADLTVFVDGSITTSSINTTSINTTVTAASSGNHTIILTASNGTTSLADTFYYSVRVNSPIVDLPDNSVRGLEYLSDEEVRLVLDAPNKDHCIVRGTFTDWRYDENFTMNQTPDGDFFWIEIDGLDSGAYYTYQYLVDMEIDIADPFSEVILDPVDDPWLDQTMWPELPPFPHNASKSVTLFRAGGFSFDWQVNNFQPPASEDLVIYELLIRDFVVNNSFVSLIDTLDYLEELGINAIQLMPVNEFEGNRGWGYNPSFHMALDKLYGNPTELKALIDEAHRRGMAVILDVVFNHAFSQSPLARLYWDQANFRPAPNNPWLNQTPRHPFNVGYDFNHESMQTKVFVKRVMKHWVENFRVDGFRFDLAKGFTQTFSGDDAALMAEYDASRIAIVKEYADFLWSLDDDFYATLEYFAVNEEEKELSDYGLMIWGKGHSEMIQAMMGYNFNNDSDFKGLDFMERGWSNPNLIGFNESHDEERLVYAALESGNSDGAYTVRDKATALSRMGMCHTFLTLFPGPKIGYQFGELGYDFSINRCVDGTNHPDCRLAPKPIRWDYLQDALRSNLFTIYQDINHLKTEKLTGTSVLTRSLAGEGKTMSLENDEIKIFIIGNFGVTDQNVSLVTPTAGTWYNFFGGDSIILPNNSYGTTLAPGEYHLYTSIPVDRYSETYTGTSSIIPASELGIRLYPNPVSSGSTLYIDNNDHKLNALFIINSSGQFVRQVFFEDDDSPEISIDQLATGHYNVLIMTEERMVSHQMIVVP